MKSLLPFTCIACLWLTSPSSRAEPIQIVAAENFYGSVAQQIADEPQLDRLTSDDGGMVVRSILTNPNQDPHEFTTSAATAKAVADANIVIYNGLSYDPWMEKLLAANPNAAHVVIKVSDLIGAKEGDNPHIWYDPKTMPALAARLVKEFSKMFPARADVFQKRLDDFNASMKPEIDRIALIKGRHATLPVTATEPVFGYMADALGFKMLNYDFQIKIMNDAEPTADETAAFEKSLTDKTAKILFYNSQVTDPTTDRIQKIARQAGIPVVGVTETQPPDQKNYAGWMLHELDGVQAALDASHG